MLSIKKEPTSAELIPLLIADVFQLAGAFRIIGDEIASDVGQTQARWQVLSAASANNKTVPQIARRLGFARQSVQRTADLLVDDGLAEYTVNVDHKKSPFLLLTRRGERVLAKITAAAAGRNEAIARAVKKRELELTLQVLRTLCSALDHPRGAPEMRAFTSASK